MAELPNKKILQELGIVPPDPKPSPRPVKDPPHGVGPYVENNPEKRNLREEAEKWLADNPHVYFMFETFALRAYESGQRFGIGFLAERVRWECLVETRSEDGWKINNNHRAYVARRLIEDHPQLASFLELRKTRY